jgi:hypothetical protein
MTEDTDNGRATMPDMPRHPECVTHRQSGLFLCTTCLQFIRRDNYAAQKIAGAALCNVRGVPVLRDRGWDAAEDIASALNTEAHDENNLRLDALRRSATGRPSHSSGSGPLVTRQPLSRCR